MTPPTTDTMAQPAPGTREALVYVLVLALAHRHGVTEEWLRRQPTMAATFRRNAEACLPVFVEFVAEWLDEYERQHALSRGSVALEWREAMST